MDKQTNTPNHNDWDGGAPLSLQKRLLYGVCSIVPGGLLYILITLLAGVKLTKSDIPLVVLFGFVLGLLFPRAMRAAFLHIRQVYDPDAHKVDDDELLYTLSMTIIIAVLLIAFA
ncbi:MAG: hypothetical protein ACNYPG_01050 [Candidatus Porifericomitaceae bacterium WSBS_2022_MAG_OTU9]